MGEEESKGNDLTREAHQLLKTAPVNFVGNVEGRDVYAGHADVIVCDGFTGNVTLKISEGLVETVQQLLHDELSATFGTRVGYLLSRQAFRRFRKRVDSAEYGGAPLVGVNGLCLIGHGRSSAKAVRNAVAMAARFVSQGLDREAVPRHQPRAHDPKDTFDDRVRLPGAGGAEGRHGQVAGRQRFRSAAPRSTKRTPPSGNR